MRSRKNGVRKGAWGGAVAACFVLPTFLTQGCEPAVQLETHTFELQYLSPSEAAEMISPYVYYERDAAPGAVTHFSSGITVRETPESLARIREVLERYDRAEPGVRLHFQIIEANGFTDTDARIADVRDALEELFRFEGYRLTGEAQLAMMEGTESRQPVAVTGNQEPWQLMASVDEVRVSGDAGAAVISVQLWSDTMGPVVRTTLNVPVGETAVLGSSRATPSGPTTILTVRPEFVGS